MQIQRNPLVALSEEVEQALTQQQPIVALESTFLSHGLPAPDNMETTYAMQEAIREAGAIPAMVAIMHGKIKVGLSEKELAILAHNQQEVMKVNSGEIAYCLAKN